MANNNYGMEKRLWDAADELRADSKLRSAEYCVPVLGLIFLRYADQKFTEAQKSSRRQGQRTAGDRRGGLPARGVLSIRNGAVCRCFGCRKAPTLARQSNERDARHEGGE